MVGLYKDPKGELIFKKSSISIANMGGRLSSKSDESEETLALKKRIKELEEALKANKVLG